MTTLPQWLGNFWITFWNCQIISVCQAKRVQFVSQIFRNPVKIERKNCFMKIGFKLKRRKKNWIENLERKQIELKIYREWAASLRWYVEENMVFTGNYVRNAISIVSNWPETTLCMNEEYKNVNIDFEKARICVLNVLITSSTYTAGILVKIHFVCLTVRCLTSGKPPRFT